MPLKPGEQVKHSSGDIHFWQFDTLHAKNEQLNPKYPDLHFEHKVDVLHISQWRILQINSSELCGIIGITGFTVEVFVFIVMFFIIGGLTIIV